LESRPASAHRHTAEFRLVRDEGGHREEPGQDESSSSQSRLRIAANEDGSMRTDATSSADDQQTLQPGNPIDEPANLTDRPDWTNFWSDIWPSFKDWLEEPVPEYDLESGQVAGTRNRITTQLGINTIHSWIGRDTQKYVPGLYWWTLLPASLAQQHGIPLSVVVGAALEHIELEGHQHLLRFYEKPEDWQSAHVMTKLYRSLPGVFDVEKLRPKLQGATTFLEINAIPHAWS
jgi:hypothetical protein